MKVGFNDMPEVRFVHWGYRDRNHGLCSVDHAWQGKFEPGAVDALAIGSRSVRRFFLFQEKISRSARINAGRQLRW